MNMRYWVPLLVLFLLSGCASRQLQSPSSSDNNIFTTLSDDRAQFAQTQESSEPDEDELETFEDPFAEDAALDDLQAEQKTISDPLEPVNRAFFTFNDKLYFWALKPVASGYGAVFPEPIRLHVRNFFNNLAFPVRFVNCFLQGSPLCASVELSRFVVNSILGIGGLFDVGTALKLPKQNEDFGQTLGVWGFGPGAYLTLPLFGPSSVRDAVGRLGDAFLDPIGFISIGILPALGIKAYEQVNKTSLSIGDYEALKEMALDPYVALRSAYFQFRQNQIQERFRTRSKPTSSEPEEKAFE